jgi:hypothetical protein
MNIIALLQTIVQDFQTIVQDFADIITIIVATAAFINFIRKRRLQIQSTARVAGVLGLVAAALLIAVLLIVAVISGTVPVQIVVNYVLQGEPSLFPRPYNPGLNTFVQGALALTVLLAIANLFIGRARFSKERLSNTRLILAEARWFVFQLIAIFLIWLAYGTPFTQLPFAAPAAGTTWLLFPADGAYLAAAVIAHGLLALAGVPWLVLLWREQLSIRPVQSRLAGLAMLCGLGLMVYGWEAQLWPVAFLIPAELFLIAPISRALSTAVFTGYSPPLTTTNATRQQARRACFLLATVAGAVFVWLEHDISLSWLSLFGVYYTFTSLDLAMACVMMVFRRSLLLMDPFGVFTTTTRCLVTVPLVLVMATLGAAGALSALTHNVGLSYTVWLEAGTAAAAYLLFRPLTDMARFRILTGDIKGQIAAGMIPDHPQLRAPNVSRPVVPSDPYDQSDDDSDDDDRAQLLSAVRRAADGVQHALRTFSTMSFPALTIFLVATLLYDPLLANLDLSSGATSALFPLVFGLAAVLVNMLPLLNKGFGPAADVSRVLLLVTIMVTAVAVLLALSPAASGPLSLGGRTSQDLLGDRHFLFVTMRSIAQLFVVLLAVGQFLYHLLLVIVNLQQPV